MYEVMARVAERDDTFQANDTLGIINVIMLMRL